MMTQFSGQSLHELELAFKELQNNLELMAELHAELLDRKQRRERRGLSEKYNAKSLRLKVEGVVGSALCRSGSNSSISSLPNSETKIYSPSFEWGTESEKPARPHQHIKRINIDFNPTSEQLAAIEAFSTGRNLRINAFAGSGKTSTLSLLSQSTERTGIYAAFNRACVRDSKSKFGSNVQCATLHGIAFRSLLKRFGKEKLIGKLNANVVLTYLPIDDFKNRVLSLSQQQLANLSLTLVRRFAQTREKQIRDIPVPTPGIMSRLDEQTISYLGEVLYSLAERLWELMTSSNSSIPLGHDGYLKYWALTEPVLKADFLLLDEAQDTNDVVLGLLERQHCQLVYVGDRHQQIYEWRGAVNALDRVQATEECELTKSFRFGQRIADAANRALAILGEKSRITGNDAVSSVIGPVTKPDSIVARGNVTVLVAVIACLDNGDIPYIEGGTDDLKRLIRGVYDLKDKGFSSVPEFFGFESWDQVVQYSETEYGQELAPFVKLVQAFGVNSLWHVLKRVASNVDEASVTISTAHKAKGREWTAVKLEDDFVLAQEDNDGCAMPIANEEIRVLYVAATRAKKHLQLGPQSLSFLNLN
jgi:hypothetical protein